MCEREREQSGLALVENGGGGLCAQKQTQSGISEPIVKRENEKYKCVCVRERENGMGG